MKTRRIRIEVLIFLTAMFFSLRVMGTVYLGGVISNDTTILSYAETVVITNNVLVNLNRTLTFESGLNVRFDGFYQIDVQGTLIADGTVTDPIVFEENSTNAVAGSWRRIYFRDAAGNSRMSYCTIDGAHTGLEIYASPGITLKPSFDHLEIQNCQYDGILIKGYARGCGYGSAQPSIVDTQIHDNGRHGIYCYGYGSTSTGCNPSKSGSVGGVVQDCDIFNNGSCGIYMRASSGYKTKGNVYTGVLRTEIHENGTDGIHLAGNDPVWPSLKSNVIYENDSVGISMHTETGYRTSYWINNTIFNNTSNGMEVVASYSPTIYINNNLVVSNGGWGLWFQATTVPHTERNSFWGNTFGGAGNFVPGYTNFSMNPELASWTPPQLTLSSSSPLIDQGVLSGSPSFDFNRIPMPLQGKQSGGVAPDVGAFEFVDWNADSDADGLPDGWELEHMLDPTEEDGNVGSDGDPDEDLFSNFHEYIADTDPQNPLSFLCIKEIVATDLKITVSWQGGTVSTQILEECANLIDGDWGDVFTNYPPTQIECSTDLLETNLPSSSYRIKAMR